MLNRCGSRWQLSPDSIMLRPRFINKPEPFNPDNHFHTNRTIRWRAEFMGEHNKLYCAGKAPCTYRHTDVYGNTYTYIYRDVKPGQSRSVQVKKDR